MIKIGITGQSGFLGTHLYNTLGLFPDEFTLIPFKDEFFLDDNNLVEFVTKCDTIVHLAAVNRHTDPSILYQTNLDLTNKLIAALEKSGTKPHLLISSSIHEDSNNIYGNSKKVARETLANWASKNKAPFTGYLFPNIFGPFGNPFYNSFIATFCHQLTHNEQPKILIDSQVPLVYVDEVVKYIIQDIRHPKTEEKKQMPASSNKNVTEILSLLETYKKTYFLEAAIPPLNDHFEINLFNTIRSYIDIKSHNPVPLKQNTDNRGTFVETIKSGTGGQFSFSTTKPGITRGNHFHTRKIERFIVINGEAQIQLRKIGTNEVLNFNLTGAEPSFVDMPIWYTHNITNTGTTDLYTLFWINEFYDPDDPDTFYSTV